MRAEIKAEWLRRLRSGEITQGTGRLRKVDDSQCCLGVLCEMAVEEGVIPPPVLDEELGCYSYRESNDGYGQKSVLPIGVSQWADLTDNPIVSPRPIATQGGHMTNARTLAEVNDNGYTFAQIADIIEEDL